ncbi:tannase/feruloyl esterase family alpha/beta hydrolase [Burkholderia gladioli]|uniref:tannase/feruloyl esterase family alpha/beta hydrolase n=1 Tax=Burkholderia gladioli TaxID=28095 RepID=UPI003132BF8F
MASQFGRQGRGPNAGDHRRAALALGTARLGGSRRRHRQDLYANLVDWVENDKAPTSIQLSSADGSASQPICMYPTKATYKGTGSIRDAANDSCQ